MKPFTHHATFTESLSHHVGFVRSLENRWTADTPAEHVTVPVGRGRTETSVNFRFIVPGVQEEDLHIETHGNTLVVRGQRRRPEGFGDPGHRQFAMSYGPFTRLVDLPEGLACERTSHQLHLGVLDIHIPYRSPGATANISPALPPTGPLAAAAHAYAAA